MDEERLRQQTVRQEIFYNRGTFMLGVRTGKVTPLAPILDTALSTSLQTRLVVTSFIRKKITYLWSAI